MNRNAMHILAGLIVLVLASQANAATKLTRLVKKIQPAVVTVVVYDINNEVANIGTGFFINKKGDLGHQLPRVGWKIWS